MTRHWRIGGSKPTGHSIVTPTGYNERSNLTDLLPFRPLHTSSVVGHDFSSFVLTTSRTVLDTIFTSNKVNNLTNYLCLNRFFIVQVWYSFSSRLLNLFFCSYFTETSTSYWLTEVKWQLRKKMTVRPLPPPL